MGTLHFMQTGTDSTSSGFQTRTGHFPIGIRKGWTDWQKDLGSLISWVKSSGLQVLDVSTADEARQVSEAGLRVGSADLLNWSGLATEDESVRSQCLSENEQLIKDASAAGVTNFFAVLLPANPSKPRKENLELLVKGLTPLAKILESHGGKLVVEGWPGPGALGCTPESLRAIFSQAASPAIGINYDPSHLIRMGIDPVRFLKEFGDRVYHVHGKDTELNAEALYEFGWEQPATLAEPHGFGLHVWRYTIPGQGCAPWAQIMDVLVSKGYKGAVSVELEDERFGSSEDGQKTAFLRSAEFLSGC